MKESNVCVNYPQPLDTLLEGDIFWLMHGNPNILYKLQARSATEWIVKYLTGPNAGEYVNGTPTAMCMKEKVH
jgi:hypothetical protein